MTKTLRTSVICTLAALGVLGPFAVAAPAKETANGQFGITPARRDVVGRPPAGLVPTRVSNTTTAGFDVKVIPVLLHQRITGEFAFSEQSRLLTAARTILAPSPSRFHLDPGDSRVVAMHWNVLPRGARAANVGVVFQGIPVVDGKRNLHVTDRLLSVNFLRLPGRYVSRGRFTGLQVTQSAPHVLRFLPRVRNTGQVVAAPRHARLIVRRADGPRAWRQRWAGDVVLPGAQRDFVVDVTHLLPAGDYVAEARMDFGRSQDRRIRARFHLTGPNTLPSARLRVGPLEAGGDSGGPAHVTAAVASTGTAPASTRISVSLLHIAGRRSDQTPVAVRRVAYRGLVPGTTRTLDLHLGDLERAHYEVVLRYRDPTNVVRSLSAEFDAVAPAGFWSRFRIWWREHGVVVVGLLALFALAAVIVWFLRRERRLRRELEARADRWRRAPAEDERDDRILVGAGEGDEDR